MKRYIIGIIITFILIVTLCSCSTESNTNTNSDKMIKLTARGDAELYINIDNIIAFEPCIFEYTTGTEYYTRIYCISSGGKSDYKNDFIVSESPEDIMKLINN